MPAAAARLAGDGGGSAPCAAPLLVPRSRLLPGWPLYRNALAAGAALPSLTAAVHSSSVMPAAGLSATPRLLSCDSWQQQQQYEG
jgi:hypothetical protein